MLTKRGGEGWRGLGGGMELVLKLCKIPKNIILTIADGEYAQKFFFSNDNDYEYVWIIRVYAKHIESFQNTFNLGKSILKKETNYIGYILSALLGIFLTFRLNFKSLCTLHKK